MENASFILGDGELLRDRYGAVRETIVRDIPGRLHFSSESTSYDVTPEVTVANDAGVHETVRVFVRVRPLLPKEHGVFETAEGEKEIVTLDYPKTIIYRQPIERSPYFIPGSVVSSAKEHKLMFTGIMGPEVTQAGVYRTVFEDRMTKMEAMENNVVFSFGTTNAGKTFTMRGNGTDPGLIHRALTDVFGRFEGRLVEDAPVSPMAHNLVWLIGDDEIQRRVAQKQQLLKLGKMDVNATHVLNLMEALSSKRNTGGTDGERMSVLPSGANGGKVGSYPHHCIFLSYLEIYNGNVLDLFEILPVQAKGRSHLRIREYKDSKTTKEKLVYVEGLSEIPVDNVEDALTLMQAGINNLHLAETNLNHQSSRSHCVFTIKIVGLDSPTNPTDSYSSVLSFCDLAGAERAEKAHTTGDRLTEARRINSSISALMNCIKKLKERDSKNKSKNTKTVIPFRDTKLTHVLKNFFVTGRVTMLVNVAPCNELLPETLTTLRFSSEATKVALTVFKPPRAVNRHREKGDPVADSTRVLKDHNENAAVAVAGNDFARSFKRFSEKHAKIRQSFYQPAVQVSPIREDDVDDGEVVAMDQPPAPRRRRTSEATVAGSEVGTTRQMDSHATSSVFASTEAVHTASMSIAVSSTTTDGGGRLSPEPAAASSGASGFATPIPMDETQDEDEDEEDEQLKYYKELAAYWENRANVYKDKYLEHKQRANEIEVRVRAEMQKKYKESMDAMSVLAKQAFLDGKSSAMNVRVDDDDVEELRKENDELQLDLEEAQKVIDTQTARIVALEEAEENLKSELQQARDALSGQDDGLKKLLQSKDEKMQELENLKVETLEAYRQLKAEFEVVSAERDSLRDEVTSTAAVLEDVKVELEGVREEIVEKEMELEELRSEEEDVEGLRAQLESLEKRHAAEMAKKQKEMDEVKKTIAADYARQLADEKEKLKQAEKNVAEFEEKMKNLDKLEAELKTLQGRVAALKTENAALFGSKVQLQEKIIDMNSKCHEATVSSMNAEKEKAVLEEKVKSFQAQLDKMNTVEREFVALKSARKEERNRRDDEVARMQALENTAESAERECKTLQASLKAIVLDKNQISEKLAAAEARVVELTQKLSSAEAEIIALKSRPEPSPAPPARPTPASRKKPTSSRKKTTTTNKSKLAAADSADKCAMNDNSHQDSFDAVGGCCSSSSSSSRVARVLLPPPAEVDDNEEEEETFLRPGTRKRTNRKNEEAVPETTANETTGAKRSRKQLLKKTKVFNDSASDSPLQRNDSPVNTTHADLRRALQAAGKVEEDSIPSVTKRGRRPRRKD